MVSECYVFFEFRRETVYSPRPSWKQLMISQHYDNLTKNTCHWMDSRSGGWWISRRGRYNFNSPDIYQVYMLLCERHSAEASPRACHPICSCVCGRVCLDAVYRGEAWFGEALADKLEHDTEFLPRILTKPQWSGINDKHLDSHKLPVRPNWR